MFTPNQLKTIDKKHINLNEAIKERRYMYLGILSEYQLYAKNQNLLYTRLNPYQHFLFKRVLHGYSVYKPEELQKMHWHKKKRIKKVWHRAQDELNLWKQAICNKAAADIFKVFWHSELAKDIVTLCEGKDSVDSTYLNTMSFKDIGINYEDVIIFFIGRGLLAKNFLELKCK